MPGVDFLLDMDPQRLTVSLQLALPWNLTYFDTPGLHLCSRHSKCDIPGLALSLDLPNCHWIAFSIHPGPHTFHRTLCKEPIIWSVNVPLDFVRCQNTNRCPLLQTRVVPIDALNFPCVSNFLFYQFHLSFFTSQYKKQTPEKWLHSTLTIPQRLQQLCSARDAFLIWIRDVFFLSNRTGPWRFLGYS